MTAFEHKEANRYYWIVKGHLIPELWSDNDIMSIYNSYFERIWGNHENCVNEHGFETAYSEKYA